MPLGRTVALDFDGVLAAYDGWRGPDHYGPPIPGMREVVAALQARGAEVVIHTTRAPTGVAAWLTTHGFPALRVAPEKPPAVVYVDDRGWRFTPNDLTIGPDAYAEHLLGLRAHWEPEPPRPVTVAYTFHCAGCRRAVLGGETPSLPAGWAWRPGGVLRCDACIAKEEAAP